MRNSYFEIGMVIIFCMVFTFSTGCRKQFNGGNKHTESTEIFSELWKVLDQRYALFAVKNIDWNEIYGQYKNGITDNMSDAELFKLLSNMLMTLKDGHIALISPFDTAVYDHFYTRHPTNFNFKNIENTYLENDYKTSGPVIYKTAAQVGYIYYNSFSRDISQEQIDFIFNELKNAKGLIIDVRNNSGGSTLNAARLVKCLISEKRLVKYELTKKGPGHMDFFEPEPFYINPSAATFTKPIVVITNRGCFSACNDFVLYVSDLSNVTIIGDQTGGGGSIPYNYILSNGWKVQYSATVTLSTQLSPVENGILPDINVSINSMDESMGRDPIIEKAFNLLQ